MNHPSPDCDGQPAMDIASGLATLQRDMSDQ